MTKAYKKFFIVTLIAVLPLILLLCLSRISGVPSLFLYCKTLLSTGFIVFSIFVAHRSESFDRLSAFCMTGLVFGALGDIFLELKGKLDNVNVLAGLLFFLVQHIAWCTGMLLAPGAAPRRKRLAITLPAAAAGAVLIIITITSISGASLGEMMIPVFIYGTLLSWDVAIPFTLRDKKDRRLLVLGIAGALFLVSDALLIKAIFGGVSDPIMGLMNLLLYYYSQFLIALSMGIHDRKE